MTQTKLLIFATVHFVLEALYGLDKPLDVESTITQTAIDEVVLQSP